MFSATRTAAVSLPRLPPSLSLLQRPPPRPPPAWTPMLTSCSQPPTSDVASDAPAAQGHQRCRSSQRLGEYSSLLRASAAQSRLATTRPRSSLIDQATRRAHVLSSARGTPAIARIRSGESMRDRLDFTASQNRGHLATTGAHPAPSRRHAAAIAQHLALDPYRPRSLATTDITTQSTIKRPGKLMQTPRARRLSARRSRRSSPSARRSSRRSSRSTAPRPSAMSPSSR
jgi:hypothetical protein